MTKHQIRQKLTKLYHHLPLPAWIGIAVLGFVVLPYGLVFGISKQAEFSYSGDTCVRQLSLLPGIQKQAGESGFEAKIGNVTSIGNVELFGSSVCFTPTKTPEIGKNTVALSPYGSWFAAKKFTLTVPEAPTARSADVIGKAISTALPLRIKLTSNDAIHDYRLAIADKITACEQEAAELACEVSKLELAPGTAYKAALYRSFKGEAEKQVVQGDVTTLLPLVIAEASVADGTVIYDLNKEFRFNFDQPIKSSDVTLKKADGQEVDVDTRQEGKTLIVTAKADLPRKADYSLVLNQVVSDSGSALSAPLTYKLTTSGGPKVAGVSVGSSGVPQTAKVTITFDQPIAESVDITKVARLAGVNGSVTKISSTQLSVNISNAPLCAAFTLTVDKGIASGSNKEISEEAWIFKSRIICGSSSVIGYSVKGRPIIAYYFGSGSSTVLYTGGMHGSERSGTTTMQAWVTYLQAHAAEVIPAGKRVVVVPNTNPDGIAANTRYNANNVNIGRNFATANWKADIETSSGVQKNGGGTSPTSEPESKALAALTRQLRPRLEISFHSQGRLVGANEFGDSVAIGDIYAKMVGYKTMFYDAEAVMGYPMTGEYEDWMGESMNIPAILIELPSASGNYLNTQQAALIRMLSV
ncbi:MAG: peptidase carboxypeptidase [Candidatus Saccharibacteria bacterium]|nr:peptidase carboxypeptidase [Candidatus Saccharibacteria bacterium]